MGLFQGVVEQLCCVVITLEGLFPLCDDGFRMALFPHIRVYLRV